MCLWIVHRPVYVNPIFNGWQGEWVRAGWSAVRLPFYLEGCVVGVCSFIVVIDAGDRQPHQKETIREFAEIGRERLR